MKECKRANCFFPDTGCDLGHLNVSQCTELSAQADTGTTPSETPDEVLLPWSGSALGLGDLSFVSGRARPYVIGILGPQNAGKTTLLGAWYLLLGRGLATIADSEFAGSYSLAGWEAVSSAMRWEPGLQPGFPPHTSSRSGRAPGLLHLSFWNAKKAQSTDYLFADAPGEWFHKWAIKHDASEGATWVADRSDVFMIVADRAALSGEDLGTARSNLKLIAHRLASARKGQPVALVWTKSDIAVSQEMEDAVRNAVLAVISDAVEFSVSVMPTGTEAGDVGTGFVELLKWTLAAQRARLELPPPSGGSDDPLFMFGTKLS